MFDWTVPANGTSATRTSPTPDGTRVVDFRRSTAPCRLVQRAGADRAARRSCASTCSRCPTSPIWIPYRTSYYERDLGLLPLPPPLLDARAGDYEVVIDSTLEPGHLTYAEHLVEGTGDEEVLISTHVCHPALANDNLSGIVRRGVLAKQLCGRRLEHSYRFLFAPGTIGPLAWLPRTATLDRVRHGLALSCVGDRDPHVQAQPTGRCRSRSRGGDHRARLRGGDHACSIGSRRAAMSGSSARRDSTCRSAP